MSNFQVRLIGDPPLDDFVYFDHSEETAGEVERTITSDWTDHDLTDLDRIMSMLETLGYQFEVKGLTRVTELMDPLGYRWEIDQKSREAASPASIAHGGMQALLAPQEEEETDG